jgi:hypothetical protein
MTTLTLVNASTKDGDNEDDGTVYSKLLRISDDDADGINA